MIHLWQETTPERYISGLVALNLPTAGDSGDWHTLNVLSALRQGHLLPLALVGKGQPFNTNDFFGQLGVLEARAAILALGEPVDEPVYVASHVRAVADMVVSLLTQGEPLSSIPIEDWVSDHGYRELASYWALLRPRLTDARAATLDAWLHQHQDQVA